jgi:hypothetical protein
MALFKQPDDDAPWYVWYVWASLPFKTWKQQMYANRVLWRKLWRR